MAVDRASVPRRSLRSALAVVLLAAFATVARAVPLSDYHERVAEAARIVEAVYVEESDLSEDEALTRVQSLVPPRESVEFDGRSIEVDNRWLTVEAAAFSSADDYDERNEILERIATRLYEIQSNVEALEKVPAHATQQERAKVEEILARPEFREPGDNAVAKKLRDLREKIGKILEKLFSRLFGAAGGESISTIIRVVVLGAGLVALLILARAIAQAVARRRSGGVKGKTKKKKIVLGEEVDESTTSADLAASARAIADRGDFRAAIRKLFVALIYQLDERDIVRLRAEATNREYLALVRSLGKLYPVMTEMTDTFERVWYGDAPIDRAGYDAFEILYKQAAGIVAQRPELQPV